MAMIRGGKSDSIALNQPMFYVIVFSQETKEFRTQKSFFYGSTNAS